MRHLHTREAGKVPQIGVSRAGEDATALAARSFSGFSQSSLYTCRKYQYLTSDGFSAFFTLLTLYTYCPCLSASLTNSLIIVHRWTLDQV